MADTELVDAEARRRAVDPQLSCIVRAPAGSGKTELLIQRYLALLGRVQRPDEILAITFTRKAAAEMVQRVLMALSQAEEPLAEDALSHTRLTHKLAQGVLANDRARGWHLFQHTEQLQIKTIDSFNASLVKSMPWLTRLGGLPQVNERPEVLYRQAVAKVLHVHHAQDELNQAIKRLLLHLDNRLDILQEMLLKLLARRDQWLRHLLPHCGDGAGQVRAELETALAQVVGGFLRQLSASINPELQQQLLELGGFAAQHCARTDRPLCVLHCFADSAQKFPRADVEDLQLWQGLADLLLTADGQWRKRPDKNCGFPAGKEQPGASMKKRMTELLGGLSDSGAPTGLWQLVRQLPPPRYSEDQWQILQALLVVLPQTVAQLWLEFSASSQVDFVEIAVRARQALVDSGNPSEQLLALDQRLQHILVDEFQDTSWLQFELLQTLTSGWEQGDGRSLFIVGDPMQSIYRFREAEVGLFLRAGSAGINGIALQQLQLRANFRSQQGVVDWVNSSFANIFPTNEDASSGAVSYAHAQAVKPPLLADALQICINNSLDMPTEAAKIAILVQQIIQHQPEQSIAILVRSRTHLRAILPHLRAVGINYQAQDIDPLSQRPVVSDAVALTRALLHRGDHLSWMTVLRAPWCGLSLADLLVFQCQTDSDLLSMLQEQTLLTQLSADGRQRVQAIVPVLGAAVAKRGRCDLRQLVEETWLQLRGPECYGASECADIEQLLLLLEKLDCGGDLLSFEQLEDELNGLFHTNIADTAAVQVMTIHRAKGLEFDHVILPGLGKRARADDKSLLRWQEHAEYGLLLAPLAARADKVSDPIYAMLEQLDKSKGDFEVSRLLYVAVTRAKRHIYLFGRAELNKDEELFPAKGSLLEKLWPAVQHYAVVDSSESGVEPSLVHNRVSAKFWRLATPQVNCARADESVHDADGIGMSAPAKLVQRIPAVVGTVTHTWLEYLVSQEGYSWGAGKIAQLQPKILAQLAKAGVDRELCQQYAQQIVSMLQTTVASSRGNWILQPHSHSCCELAISGVDDEDNILNLIVDRTFVDAGERWIVDYKTATPVEGQSHASFYAQQDQHYRKQLETYAFYLAQLYPEHKCRCALYFPSFDGWYELHNQSESKLETQLTLFG
ncbi:MAG: UvrD-helicase domain-containing protein [Desulfuromonas sp.]|nr:UvrD-helicase domain-containing protein [Desulfuromonas sp.]